ncbi:hypothetical protein N9A88_00550 [Akkermansiaceae bacterium]|nr:hypothetical protein [Akkermansiaceae bacterium]
MAAITLVDQQRSYFVLDVMEGGFALGFQVIKGGFFGFFEESEKSAEGLRIFFDGMEIAHFSSLTWVH